MAVPTNPLLRAALLLVLVGLTVGTTALVLRSLGPEPTGSSDHSLLVLGPDGPLWNGTVHADPATPYQALLAAAEAGGLDVHTRHYPGYAPCELYVDRINDHQEGPDGGWIYEIRQGGAWKRPAVGACAYSLEPGDAIRWRYADA